MAVLPTPGSPISTGLFFVRRESTCITRRISSSRPITGSIFSWRAKAVKSRQYFSKDCMVASGSWLVIRWLPRTALSADIMLSFVMPFSFSIRPQPPSDSAMAIKICSVERYWSFNVSATLAALARIFATSPDMAIWAAPLMRGKVSKSFWVSSIKWRTEPPIRSTRGGTIPSSC